MMAAVDSMRLWRHGLPQPPPCEASSDDSKQVVESSRERHFASNDMRWCQKWVGCERGTTARTVGISILDIVRRAWWAYWERSLPAGLVLRPFWKWGPVPIPTWPSVNQQEMQGTSSLSTTSRSILSEFCWSYTPVVSFSTPGGFEVLGKCSQNMENVYKKSQATSWPSLVLRELIAN
jgi:hypothetical protein